MDFPYLYFVTRKIYVKIFSVIETRWQMLKKYFSYYLDISRWMGICILKMRVNSRHLFFRDFKFRFHWRAACDEWTMKTRYIWRNNNLLNFQACRSKVNHMVSQSYIITQMPLLEWSPIGVGRSQTCSSYIISVLAQTIVKSLFLMTC